MQQLKTRGAGELKSTMHHRRASRRYPMKQKVIFSCEAVDALFPSASGFTENVSATGISFVTEVAVEVGSYISLNLHIRTEADQARTILLHAEGTVLRVESAGTRKRIVAEIRFQEDPEEGFAVSSTIQ